MAGDQARPSTSVAAKPVARRMGRATRGPSSAFETRHGERWVSPRSELPVIAHLRYLIVAPISEEEDLEHFPATCAAVLRRKCDKCKNLEQVPLALTHPLIPAKAGIQATRVPACAGTSGMILLGRNMLSVQDTARTLGLEVAKLEIRRAEDIAPAFEALQGHAEALYVAADPLVATNRIRIYTLALGARPPTMPGIREYVEAGGLMSDGANVPTCSGVPATMSTRFCAGRSRATSRSSSRRERFPFRWNRKHALDSCICRIFYGEPLHTSPKNGLVRLRQKIFRRR